MNELTGGQALAAAFLLIAFLLIAMVGIAWVVDFVRRRIIWKIWPEKKPKEKKPLSITDYLHHRK